MIERYLIQEDSFSTALAMENKVIKLSNMENAKKTMVSQTYRAMDICPLRYAWLFILTDPVALQAASLCEDAP
jgi:hypothetical protein